MVLIGWERPDLEREREPGETDLDVEQSGGLAPDAKVIVYQAPNTDSGFADAFFDAASQNLAGSARPRRRAGTRLVRPDAQIMLPATTCASRISTGYRSPSTSPAGPARSAGPAEPRLSGADIGAHTWEDFLSVRV
jgi:hypothetical protein